MKEVRYFYVPDAANQVELPAEEATHALRVLLCIIGRNCSPFTFMKIPARASSGIDFT
jgi:hypothetical protein